MPIKKVILAGFDENGNDSEVEWWFNAAGPMQQINTFPPQQRTEGNADGYQYLGTAAAGVATSAASWAICRWNTSGDPVVIQWADGNMLSDNVWDNRTSLSYS